MGKILFATVGFAALVLASEARAQEDRRLCVYNQKEKRVITAIHAARPDSNRWGKNLIAGSRLGPGNMMIVDFGDGTNNCVFDIRATFDDGNPSLGKKVDVCNRAWWVVYDGQMKQPNCPLDVERR